MKQKLFYKKILNYQKTQNRKFLWFFQHCLHKTLWNEVFSLNPATLMEVDLKSANITKKKYWSFKKRYINLKTANEELESTIGEICKTKNKE